MNTTNKENWDVGFNKHISSRESAKITWSSSETTPEHLSVTANLPIERPNSQSPVNLFQQPSSYSHYTNLSTAVLKKRTSAFENNDALLRKGNMMVQVGNLNSKTTETCHGVCCEIPKDTFLPTSERKSQTHCPQEDSVQYNNVEVECPICFTDVPPGDAIILGGCGHTLCLDCFKRYVDTQVEGGKAGHIICPMPADECGECVLQDELRKILGKDGYEKLARHALHSIVASDPTLHHCPTPDCQYVARWVEGDPTLLSCPTCKKSSCLDCKVAPFHEGMTCSQYERKNQKKTMKRRLLRSLSFRSQKLSAKEMEEQKTSKYLKKLKIRSCKKCGAQIVKEDGCNKMKCRCGYRFCYICESENAQCGHTAAKHGFVDNVTGESDFSLLTSTQSPQTYM